MVFPMARKLNRTTLGSCFSEGARLLWLALAERKWTQAMAETKIGTAAGLVNRWLYGDQRPGLAYALALQKLFNIPLVAWNQEPKKRFELPALAKTGGEAA